MQSGKSAQVKITAFSSDNVNGPGPGTEAGVNFVDGYADDTSVTISNVTVFNASGAAPAVAYNMDGSATITGVEAGDKITYTTTSDHNRVLIENGALTTATGNTHADFDIGGFKLLQASSTRAEVGSHVKFEDDGPSISTTGTEPTLTVDETVLATNDTKSFAANFTSAFGADGAGTLVYALGISASGADSGLVDTATGNHVFLFVNAGVVEGREGTDATTAAAGAIVFTVSAAANGDVTLDQLRAGVHPDTTNPDDSKTLSADNLVTLTGTITDKDGDNRSATLNIGSNLVFKDDGPSINTTGTEPTLTVDETVLATNDTKNFAANFTSAFGADGAGTLVYALGISATGADSGLVDTATGNHVFLFVNAGVVEGRAGTDATTAATGALVFTVSAAANGDVTLDQLRAVVHPDATNPDDSKTLSADNLVTLTGTITDKDGDSRSAALNIGSNLVFKDDGPSISTTGTEVTLTVDETVLATNDTKSFAANFTSAFGADGAGTLVYALGISASGADSGLVDTATGNHVFLFVNAGVVEGREGTDATTAAAGAIVFTVSAAANGDVTLDQLRAGVHPDTTNPDDSKTLSADNLVTLTGTITDKDGDNRSATLNIGSNLVFKDDGPSINTTGTEPTLTVDETVLATNDTKNFAANFTSAFGADGAGTLVYALGISATGADSGLVDTATGNHVFLFVNAGVVEGRAGTDATTAATGALVFTVSAAANGDVTLDQLRAVVHPDTTNPDDSKTLSADNLVTLTGTITDKDGDSRSAALNIGSNLVFKDDGPAVSANATVKLDDDALAGGNAGGTGDDINAENTSGTLGHSFGADGAGSIAYLTAGAPTGFTYEKSGDNLLVKQGTTTVLTLTLNTVTGAYAVTQNAPIMHAAGLDENNTAFTVNYQVTDKDGDTANGTLSVNVDDDTPTLDFGNLVGTGTILPQYGEWNGSVGADQPGNLDISLSQFQLVRPDNTTVNGSSFTFSELAGSPNAAGDYLFTGSLTADFDNNASTADTTNNFTLTAFHDGRYAFDLQQGFGSTITFSSANGSLGAGGPDPVQTLTIPPDEQVVFFGVQATTSNSNILSAITLGAPDLTEAQIEAANFSFISSQNMNVSNSGIGVGNNNLDGNTTAGIDAGDESFVVNPETLLTGMKVFIDNSVGGYDPATEELYYKIFFDDGTTSANIKVVSGDLTAEAGGQKSFGINTEGSKLIDSVQLTMGKGTVKIPVIEFIQSSENLASDIKLDFTASLADADSDTATSNFSVDLFANDLPANSYTLLGATSDLDSFDVDLAASQVSYRIEGFDTPDDTLFLLGDSTAIVSINNSGTDSIVSVAETTGGQTTVITVVGADLLTSNIVLV